MKQPQYEKMPEHYLLCFNDKCELADNCLLRFAAKSGRLKDEVLTVVNPNRFCGKDCRYYRENKTVTMAYGMMNSFHQVKADDMASLRNKLIGHFGRGSYYLRRNGLRGITPEEQQYIASVFRSYGYEVRFDKTAEETQWL